jgi:hypothetical protein
MVEIKSDVPTVKVIDFGSTFELEFGLPKIVNSALHRLLHQSY